jgi:hypothetical protein
MGFAEIFRQRRFGWTGNEVAPLQVRVAGKSMSSAKARKDSRSAVERRKDSRGSSPKAIEEIQLLR